MKSLIQFLSTIPLLNSQKNSQKKQNSIDLKDYLTLKGGDRVSDKYAQPTDLVNLIVSNLFIIAGLIIFVLIIGAGLSFLKDSGKGKEEAKNLATGAVIGFIVMFGAYWIIQIVEVIFNLTIL